MQFNHIRDKMSELLFNLYKVPKIAYGIDMLFSYYYTIKKKDK